MKDFLGKIGDFFKNIIDRCRSDKKFMGILIGCVSLVIIAAVAIPIAVHSAKDKNADQTSALTPIITATPKPTEVPTATPTAEPTPEPTSEPTEEPTPEPTPDLHIGEVRSELDGSWIKEEDAQKRPFAIMLNNIKYANPQSGVGEAKILYEALVEGGITRLMGIFEGIDENSSCITRMGSIRSARHYYVSVMNEYDAIYIHWGGAYYAYDKMEEMGIKDDLDGMYLGQGVFYRDNNLESPHNGFFSFAEAYKYLESRNRRMTHKDGYTPQHFTFNDTALYPEDSKEVYDGEGNVIVYDTDATAALKIVLSYDRWNQPYMVYVPEKQIYQRYQFGGIHIDYNTQQPLEFANVIIQIVHEWDKDRNDYQDMELEDTSGKGYYISMGQCVPITWKKNEKAGTMMYYDRNGEQLKINPGKTFISLYPDFRENNLEILDTLEATE